MQQVPLMADAFYSPDQLQRFQQCLVELAQEPPTQFSKKQVIEALFDDIQSALHIHSYEHVAQRLRNEGLEISTGSLKQYFTRTRRERQGKGAGKHKRTKKAKPSVMPEAHKPSAQVNSTSSQRPLPQGSDDIQLAY